MSTIPGEVQSSLERLCETCRPGSARVGPAHLSAHRNVANLLRLCGQVGYVVLPSSWSASPIAWPFPAPHNRGADGRTVALLAPVPICTADRSHSGFKPTSRSRIKTTARSRNEMAALAGPSVAALMWRQWPGKAWLSRANGWTHHISDSAT